MRRLGRKCNSALQRKITLGKNGPRAEALETRSMLTSIVVNTTVDALFPPGSGFISLRNALATADTSATPTTITFDPAVFASQQTILENGTGLASSPQQPLNIIGPTAGVIIDGHAIGTVLVIVSGSFTASNLTITNGIAGGIVNPNFANVTLNNFNIQTNGGSGIINSGTMTLNNALVTGNTSDTKGGGVYNRNNGHLTINNSTITFNTANDGGGVFSQSAFLTMTNVTLANNNTRGTTGRGGGLFNLFGPATLTNVTSNANSSADGAGIDNANAAMTLLNSTITGNTATGDGGGLSNGDAQDSGSGTLTVTNCTIYGNTGKTGGGLYGASNCSTYISNSIVAGNALAGTGATAPDASGSFNSLGYNLVGKTDGSAGSWNANDLTGTIASPLNAQLAPLDNYGGPLRTLVPLAGSPAINAGLNAFAVDGTFNPLPTDERGYPRIYNGKVDIGAVEYQPKVISLTPGENFLTLLQTPDHRYISWTVGETADDPFATGGMFLITDPEGAIINGNGANDTINLQYTSGNPLPSLLRVNGTFTINGLTGSSPFDGINLDIAKSTLYITYASPATDPLTSIRGYLKTGYNNGLWNGTSGSGAIQSSAAAATPLVNSIGYADSADTANPAALPANTLELRYTVIGDTNLDGTVDLQDLAALLKSFNTGTQWDQGQLSYGTTVGLTDLAALLKHFGQTAASPAALPGSTSAALPTLSASLDLLSSTVSPTADGSSKESPKIEAKATATALVKPASTRHVKHGK